MTPAEDPGFLEAHMASSQDRTSAIDEADRALDSLRLWRTEHERLETELEAADRARAVLSSAAAAGDLQVADEESPLEGQSRVVLAESSKVQSRFEELRAARAAPVVTGQFDELLRESGISGRQHEHLEQQRMADRLRLAALLTDGPGGSPGAVARARAAEEEALSAGLAVGLELDGIGGDLADAAAELDFLLTQLDE